MTLKALPFAAGLLALGTTAAAAHPPHEGRDAGPVTREEAVSRALARFEAADADGNGQLTFEEVEEQRGERRARRAKQMFDRQDRNDDGVVTPNEIEANVAERFAKIDTDGDGVLGEDERKAARETFGEKRAKRRG